MLGAGSVEPARTQASASPVSAHVPDTHVGAAGGHGLSLQFAAAPAQTIWILVSPDASFQERLASKELARGLRNLGLAREPIQAVASAGEARSLDLVFTLVVNHEVSIIPRLMKFQTRESRAVPLEFACEGPRRGLSFIPCLISWNGRGLFSVWTVRCIPPSPLQARYFLSRMTRGGASLALTRVDCFRGRTF